VTTTRRRTRETAERIAAYGWEGGWQPEVLPRAGAVQNLRQWEELVRLVGDGGAFVGHHPTQEFLLRACGAPRAPRENRCVVYVLERGDAGWRCVDHWMGVPAT
jgi:hypothetical protein